jgi:GntR family transcriptional regulator/MocR family aminotransferase
MEFAIALDPKSDLALHRQLYEAFRQLILSGQLLPKQRLPSTRALAHSLAISRTTVTQCYEQLISEGYLQAVRSSGTFVCAQLPDDLLHSPLQELQPNQSTSKALSFSIYGASLTNDTPLYSPRLELPISFRYGQPDLNAFPVSQWRQLLSRHCRKSDRVMLDYATDSLGHQPLREAIARYLVQSRAVQCNADQILIVSGSQQALDLVSRVLIDRSDGIALEDPGYLGARHIFLAQGARLYPLPVDSSGVVVEALWKESPHRIKLVYVTPSHQFPTGAVLSLSRRLELLTWAEQAGALIIEDDYDSKYRYEGRPIPALQGLDQTSSVIYIGTFSKSCFPLCGLDIW